MLRLDKRLRTKAADPPLNESNPPTPGEAMAERLSDEVLQHIAAHAPHGTIHISAVWLVAMAVELQQRRAADKPRKRSRASADSDYQRAVEQANDENAGTWYH